MRGDGACFEQQQPTLRTFGAALQVLDVGAPLHGQLQRVPPFSVAAYQSNLRDLDAVGRIQIQTFFSAEGQGGRQEAIDALPSRPPAAGAGTERKAYSHTHAMRPCSRLL